MSDVPDHQHQQRESIGDVFYDADLTASRDQASLSPPISHFSGDSISTSDENQGSVVSATALEEGLSLNVGEMRIPDRIGVDGREMQSSRPLSAFQFPQNSLIDTSRMMQVPGRITLNHQAGDHEVSLASEAEGPASFNDELDENVLATPPLDQGDGLIKVRRSAVKLSHSDEKNPNGRLISPYRKRSDDSPRTLRDVEDLPCCSSCTQTPTDDTCKLLTESVRLLSNRVCQLEQENELNRDRMLLLAAILSSYFVLKGALLITRE